MSAESKYQEIIKQLNLDVERAVKDACEKVHSEIIPYINDDTDSNARYRAHDIVSSILRGNFEVDGDAIKVDGWRIDQITSNKYDKLTDALASKMSDRAKDLKIEQLERIIAELSEFKYL